MPPDEPRSPGGTGAVDDTWLQAWLETGHRRWRWQYALWSAVVALAAACVIHVLVAPHGGPAGLAGAVAGGCVGILCLLTAEGLRSVVPLVDAAEAHTPALANALLAWHEAAPSVPVAIRAPLARQARAALESSAIPPAVPLERWAITLACLVLAVGIGWVLPPVAHVAGGAGPSTTPAVPAAGAGTALAWQVTVRPPAYTSRPTRQLATPALVDALVGSAIEMRFDHWPPEARARLGQAALTLDGSGATRVATLVARQSDALVVDVAGRALATIVIVVRQDAPPDVRITMPGADQRRATATGRMPIRITARDDIGLRDLRLRYTKVSGSGESFTFEDGEWAVRVRQTSATQWAGEHVVDLASLGLGPGDSVAYHAVAHDARPGPEGAAESERFLIEIAREGALAAGDFSLPEPEETFALSQRMVIQLTERLLEKRARMSAAAYRDEAVALALAQRRVRAEFVFMLGGEVEDEVEEAAHSHEVEAGRLDNRGQGDLTTAVRQMAQAEARLTDAEVREALPYEYRALAALQAAFGKARYFMRTLPAPVQLDGARRLQGDRTQASPARWTRSPFPESSRIRALALLARVEQQGAALAALVAPLIALDRTDAQWVTAVQAAVSDRDAASLGGLLRARLLAGGEGRVALPLPLSAEEAALAALERRP